MSTFQLKIIAVITMLIDHTGALLFPQYRFLRAIGRLAFPIFAFLIASGYRNTKSPLKYAARLFAFGLVSEVPFDLAFKSALLEFNGQNVFFTLLLGLLAIWGFDKMKKKGYLLPGAALVALCAALAWLLRSDYMWMGVLAIFVFYIAAEYGLSPAFGALAASFITMAASMRQIYAVFSAAPIALYNGRRGIRLKYAFYAFYPLHLLALWLIKTQI